MNTGGLKYKLIKLQLTLTMAVLTISWSLITINDYYLFKNLSIKSFETTSRILARNLSTCLAFQDEDECQRVVNKLAGEKEVLKITVVDGANKIISSFERKNTQSIKHDLSPAAGDDFQVEIRDDIISSSYPVIENGILEGRLYIISEFDLVGTFLKRHALYFIFIMLGSMLIGIFLSTHFQRKITNQINLILDTINNIRRQQNYTLRATNDVSLAKVEIDEFKQLTRSFDDMIEQIQMKDATLQMRNEDLQRMVEAKVQELYKEKEKAVHNAELASLGEMAGGIAHEINNPLAIIMTSTLLMGKLMKKDKIDKNLFLEHLREIEMTIERIAKIITGMRNITRRSEDGEKVPCCFQDIFDDVFEIAKMKFMSKGVEIRKKYSEEDLKKVFITNRIQLSQVLVNLLNNAYDAVGDKKEKWVEVEIGFSNDLVTLRITDSGNGIPLAIREKMFNPFYTTKEIGKGTGIGLSISKSMVEKNGGQFFYDDQSSHTSFVIQIPYKKIKP